MNRQSYIDRKRVISGRMFFVALFLIAGSMSQPALAADIKVTNARIVLPKDDSITMPGYLTLENLTDKEIILIKIRSRSFKLSMIHQSISDRGNPRMVLKPELLIKPKAKVVMKPGDVHFMFAGANGKLKKGKKVSVNLYLNTGDKMPVEFELVK